MEERENYYNINAMPILIGCEHSTYSRWLCMNRYVISTVHMLLMHAQSNEAMCESSIASPYKQGRTSRRDSFSILFGTPSQEKAKTASRVEGNV